MLSQLNQIQQKIINHERVDPKPFLLQLYKEHNQFRPNLQGDAHELICCIIDDVIKIQNQSDGKVVIKDEQLIEKYFNGQVPYGEELIKKYKSEFIEVNRAAYQAAFKSPLYDKIKTEELQQIVCQQCNFHSLNYSQGTHLSLDLAPQSDDEPVLSLFVSVPTLQKRQPVYKLLFSFQEVSKSYVQFCLSEIVTTLFEAKSLPSSEFQYSFYSVEFNAFSDDVLTKIANYQILNKTTEEEEESEEPELSEVTKGCILQNQRLFGTDHVIFCSIQPVQENTEQILVAMQSNTEASLVMHVRRDLIELSEQQQAEYLKSVILPNFSCFGSTFINEYQALQKTESQLIIKAKYEFNVMMALKNAKHLKYHLITLQQCLDAFSNVEQMEWKCRCGAVGGEKQHFFINTSKCLIINLKRFVFNMQKMKIVKDSRAIEFAEEFVLFGKKYFLKCVVCHFGQLSKGHYVSLVKKDKWWLINDDKVNEAQVDFVKNYAQVLYYESE